MSINTIKKWINHIVSLLLVLAILLMVFFLVSSKINGGTPKVFGNELLTVLSGSMEPEIKTGSVIAMQPNTDSASYEVGDVITYKSIDNPNVLITHRILEVQKNESGVNYVTKGDNNDAIDSTPVPASNVVGEYSGFTIPFIGYVLNFVKSTVGTILLVIIPGILLIGWSIVSVWRTIKSIDDEAEAKVTK